MNKKRKKIIVLDGYNIIHQVPELERHLATSLEKGREALCRFCSNWMATRKDVWLFYIVFDGQSGIAEHDYQPGPGIRAIYTETGEKADTRIIHIVEEQNNISNITVVSDDNFVRRHSRDLGAELMSAAAFFDTPATPHLPAGRAELDNDKKLTSKQKKDINESLKQEWGIS